MGRPYEGTWPAIGNFSVKTKWGVGRWWDEDDSYFFVDFSGGGLTLDFEKDGARLCAEASWYSHSVSNETNFQ